MFDSHSKARTTDSATDTKLLNPVVACERERKYNVSMLVAEMEMKWPRDGMEMEMKWQRDGIEQMIILGHRMRLLFTKFMPS